MVGGGNCELGYGDVYPVTMGGKIVAMVLMMCGVGMFSLSAALFAAWIISEVRSATLPFLAAVMRLQKNGGLGGSRKNKFYCFDSLSLAFYSKS